MPLAGPVIGHKLAVAVPLQYNECIRNAVRVKPLKDVFSDLPVLLCSTSKLVTQSKKVGCSVTKLYATPCQWAQPAE